MIFGFNLVKTFDHSILMRVECPERSASGVEGQTLMVSVLGYSLELRPQNKKSNVLSDLELAEMESRGTFLQTKMKHFFYIARCKDKTLYTGITNNLEKRIIRHNKDKGSQWIKQHGEAQIVYSEEHATYLEVRRRELQVKKWSRKKKENLIKNNSPL